MFQIQKKCFVFVLSLLCCTGMVQAGCGAHLNADVQQLIDKDREKYAIPGLQLSISCPGEEVPRDFVSGHTTRDGEEAVRPDHFFQTAHIDSYLAVIVMQLEAEKLLSTEDPLSKYLINLPESWGDIKISQLLNHTSGIQAILRQHLLK